MTIRNGLAAGHWTGHHLHYHGEQDLLLASLLIPILHRWFAAGSLERFFFVRYALGGPHIRLRCRWRDTNAEGRFQDELTRVATRFFERHPSASSWSPDTIRQRNRGILAHDPSEVDDVVYPDHYVRQVIFEPETDRYGGEALVAASLEVFCLSSLAVCDALASAEFSPKESKYALQVLAAQAVASVEDTLDFSRLMESLGERARRRFPAALDQADERFAQTGRAFSRGLYGQLRGPASDAVDRLQAGLRLLRRQLGEVGDSASTVLMSQLHMTANRLGLSNLREVYLLRLLECAAGQWLEEDLALPPTSGQPSAGAPDSLAELVNGGLDRFASSGDSSTLQPVDSRAQRRGP
ncbi:MAG: thiopeptide-type bacteriocin biosynthesis protein [Acidobacteriota bacterium]